MFNLYFVNLDNFFVRYEREFVKTVIVKNEFDFKNEVFTFTLLEMIFFARFHIQTNYNAIISNAKMNALIEKDI